MLVITNKNIYELVDTYYNNKYKLPKELQNISKWDVSRVTDMSGLFKIWKDLMQIYLSGMYLM